MNRQLIIFLLLNCFLLNDCNRGTPYSNNQSISTKSGEIIDSSIYFLPSKYMISRYWISKDIDSSYVDTFKLRWFTANYLNFKEPILYNYYFGYECYRLLWLRSFHRPVMITIKRLDKIILNTKILSQIPSFETYIYVKDYGPEKINGIILSDDTNIEHLRKEYPKADSIVVPKLETKLDLDTTYVIQIQQWEEFKKLISECGYWGLKPTESTMGLDGSEWILEGQIQRKYKFVDRWSPKNSFAKCCKYLISLSAAKDEEIY